VPVRECVFCGIVAGEIPAYRVYDVDGVVAFLDRAQVNPGHVLVVPKDHAENLFDVAPAQAAQLFEVAHHLAPVVRRTFGADGLTVLQANGAAGGQTVSHLHLHVLPRFVGDAVSIDLPTTNPSASTLMERAEALQRALA